MTVEERRKRGIYIMPPPDEFVSLLRSRTLYDGSLMKLQTMMLYTDSRAEKYALLDEWIKNYT